MNFVIIFGYTVIYSTLLVIWFTFSEPIHNDHSWFGHYVFKSFCNILVDFLCCSLIFFIDWCWTKWVLPFTGCPVQPKMGSRLFLDISEQLEWSYLTSSNVVLKYFEQACPLPYAGTRHLLFPMGTKNAKTLMIRANVSSGFKIEPSALPADLDNAYKNEKAYQRLDISSPTVNPFVFSCTARAR